MLTRVIRNRIPPFLFFPQACPDRNDQHRAVHGITRFINDKPYDSGKILKKNRFRKNFLTYSFLSSPWNPVAGRRCLCDHFGDRYKVVPDLVKIGLLPADGRRPVRDRSLLREVAFGYEDPKTAGRMRVW